MILALQIAVILVLSRATRWLFVAVKQPGVIGEMVAGLLLGPSCFGWLMPRSFAALFAPATLTPLNTLSQIGLILFMFIVGLRLRSHSPAGDQALAIAVSGASIVVPFALGAWMAVTVHGRLAPAGVGVLPFSLFVGAAMSITAFPVLARILIDHRLLTTDLGVLAITCAAFDDVTGWLILAGILSLLHGGDPHIFWLRLMLFLVYLAVMMLVVRRALQWAARQRWFASKSPAAVPGMLLPVVFVSAWATDALGVHALFGAFFAGLIMPVGADIERLMAQRVEPLTLTVLLPLFFAFAGLRTNVQLINDWALWQDALIFLAVAIAGKGGASTLVARAMGLAWREAVALGVLLNTRGLIELVILNIGIELRILSPVVYSMLVLMALFTTVITSPIITQLRLVAPGRRISSVASV